MIAQSGHARTGLRTLWARPQLRVRALRGTILGEDMTAPSLYVLCASILKNYIKKLIKKLIKNISG
jgi:hypothetical protein